MNQPLTLTEGEVEALDLRPRLHEWLNDLAVAGVEERGAISAIHIALVERVLINLGTQPTVAWLREMANQMEQHGDAILQHLKGNTV